MIESAPARQAPCRVAPDFRMEQGSLEVGTVRRTYWLAAAPAPRRGIGPEITEDPHDEALSAGRSLSPLSEGVECGVEVGRRVAADLGPGVDGDVDGGENGGGEGSDPQLARVGSHP
jgi:hypothetical protein